MSDNRLMAIRFLVALALSIICLVAPAWADFKSGEKAYQRGDYATALREWQPLAKQGQAVAQYQLGLLSANGQGVPKDDAEARQWYEKAAAQGHANAQVNLGSLYDYGRGGFQDGCEMVSSRPQPSHLASLLNLLTATVRFRRTR
jgi:TPR repeat protein